MNGTVTLDVLAILAAARSHEDAGRYSEAETGYLRARAEIDDREKRLKGVVSLSLGHTVERVSRVGDAIKYYAEAIAYLEGEKGEALLQNAHAHFNIARLYLANSDRRAIRYSERAVERYARYPYTAPADLADAKALRMVAKAHIARRFSEEELRDVWSALRGVPFASLNRELVMNFLLILFAFLRKVRGDEFEPTLRDLIAWADYSIANDVLALIEGRGEEVKLRERLQRALLGLPDEWSGPP